MIYQGAKSMAFRVMLYFGWIGWISTSLLRVAGRAFFYFILCCYISGYYFSGDGDGDGICGWDGQIDILFFYDVMID